jgi:hypothetical protein
VRSISTLKKEKSKVESDSPAHNPVAHPAIYFGRKE